MKVSEQILNKLNDIESRIKGLEDGQSITENTLKHILGTMQEVEQFEIELEEEVPEKKPSYNEVLIYLQDNVLYTPANRAGQKPAETQLGDWVSTETQEGYDRDFIRFKNDLMKHCAFMYLRNVFYSAEDIFMYNDHFFKCSNIKSIYNAINSARREKLVDIDHRGYVFSDELKAMLIDEYQKVKNETL